MEVRLVVEKGGKRSRVFTLQSEETILGRRQDCDVRIPSAEVSRRHCLLSVHEGCLNVEDLDSVNGTFVNGRRISGREVVYPGDRLKVGPVSFVAEYEITQDTLDRLEAVAPASPPDDGEVDVLPVVEETADGDAPTVAGADEAVSPVDDDDAAIPLAEELEVDGGWKLPASGDLRDLLSQMDDSKSRPQRKED